MNQKCIRYKDVLVAPGTQMFEALEAKDHARAKRIYDECEEAARKLQGGSKSGRNYDGSYVESHCTECNESESECLCEDSP